MTVSDSAINILDNLRKAGKVEIFSQGGRPAVRWMGKIHGEPVTLMSIEESLTESIVVVGGHYAKRNK